MSKLRYSVTVQFDIDAGDAATLERRINDLEESGTIIQIKAKSAGAGKKEPEEK